MMDVGLVMERDEEARIEDDQGEASNTVRYGVHLLAEALVPFRIPLGPEFVKAPSSLKGIDGGQIYPDGLVNRLADSLPGESSPGLERSIGSLVEIANGGIHVCIVIHVCVVVKGLWERMCSEQSQSQTVADSWDVAPSEARLRLVTERVIEVATEVGVGVGAVGVSSPPQLPKSSENNRALNATVLFIRPSSPRSVFTTYSPHRTRKTLPRRIAADGFFPLTCARESD